MPEPHDILTDEPEEASPRAFGLTFAAVAVIYGLWPIWSGRPVRMWALAIAVVLLAVSVTRPASLAGPSRLWMKVGLALHRIVNPIVMGLLFYAVVTPFAVVWRWRNRAQAASFQPDPGAFSYWKARTDPPGPMQRQF